MYKIINKKTHQKHTKKTQKKEKTIKHKQTTQKKKKLKKKHRKKTYYIKISTIKQTNYIKCHKSHKCSSRENKYKIPLM